MMKVSFSGVSTPKLSVDGTVHYAIPEGPNKLKRLHVEEL
jgi:hypothetical protein